MGSNVKFTQFVRKTKTHITTLSEKDNNENSLFLYLVVSLWNDLGTWRHHKKKAKKKPERADHEQTDVVNNSAD